VSESVRLVFRHSGLLSRPADEVHSGVATWDPQPTGHFVGILVEGAMSYLRAFDEPLCVPEVSGGGMLVVNTALLLAWPQTSPADPPEEP
jgi:hypothetical protein